MDFDGDGHDDFDPGDLLDIITDDDGDFSWGGLLVLLGIAAVVVVIVVFVKM